MCINHHLLHPTKHGPHVCCGNSLKATFAQNLKPNLNTGCTYKMVTTSEPPPNHCKMYWSQYCNTDPSVVFFLSFSFQMCATLGGFWRRWKSLVGSTGSTRPSCERLYWPVKTRRLEVLLIDQETWWATTHSYTMQWGNTLDGSEVCMWYIPQSRAYYCHHRKSEPCRDLWTAHGTWPPSYINISAA